MAAGTALLPLVSSARAATAMSGVTKRSSRSIPLNTDWRFHRGEGSFEAAQVDQST
ncbi:MAG: hypothetical protein NTX28_10965 [Novosphingobium sp.]|nr:hypothetical protein [Novosphingobium sp.]